MAILTKFLQLLKPERNDYVDVEKHLSENYDKIDAKMEELSNSNDEKLDKGNVPDVLNSAEKIIKALQGNTGIKFDENLLYLNDAGTKNVGFCYLDRLTDGIFECIQETTTTVNNATYFKNFSNKENSDRLSNLFKGTGAVLFEQIWEGIPLNSWKEFNLNDSVDKYTFLIFTCNEEGTRIWGPRTNSFLFPVSLFLNNAQIGMNDIFVNGCIGIKKGTSNNKIFLSKYIGTGTNDDPENYFAIIAI